MSDIGFSLRPAVSGDAGFLADMVVAAVDWDPAVSHATPEKVLADRRNAHYVEGWPLADDLGVVAVDAEGEPAPPSGRAPARRMISMLSGMSDAVAELDPEDKKIITLARSARARNGVPEGAAVRDETGRTYVAGTVALESLRLSALQTAVAMAVAGGAKGLEAAAVVTAAGAPAAADVAAVRDLGGPGTPVLLAGPDGVLRSTALA